MDRRLSAVLTHVLAGRTRHRKRRSYGATLTRAAKRPRVAAAVGASTRLVAQAFFPAIQPRPAGPRYPAATWAVTHDRGLAGGCAAESPPADPTLGGSRSAERGCTGRAGRCSRPRRRFGCRRRRAPSVRRRRRGVCHCASAQPCLDWSPTPAGQTLLGLAIPAGRLGVVALGRVTPARVLRSCGAGGGGWGWAGWAWPEGLGPTGADVVGRRASLDRRAGRGVPGSCEPVRSAAVDPGPGAGLAVTELLARVAGSSVSSNCPGADQGGRHVDMVVGADHRGRAGVGVWRAAASRPLTARHQRPGHG
jgi:hypothetical protein